MLCIPSPAPTQATVSPLLCSELGSLRGERGVVTSSGAAEQQSKVLSVRETRLAAAGTGGRTQLKVSHKSQTVLCHRAGVRTGRGNTSVSSVLNLYLKFVG